MDFFQWLLIICGLAGGALLLAAVFGKEAERPAPIDADAAINELSDLSKDVFSQFDSKYQELLYLYNLIDEKQAAAAPAPVAERRALNIRVGDDEPIPRPSKQTAKGHVYKNERFERVLALRDQGLDAEAIAKRLGIGKGEASLILELNKHA